ncbi:hypothetical protein Clacol_002166 [Clathrus columnatus]|uniref:Alpha/beta hydrolase fold-3 domain-containing protein n=1 Tax=Clathrus columnatus TaxID=1419009 RepID=A0AAV5A5C6_9AGAM|nr:hypothetical protein Clacol_002166 [Clathrus columnatus]
MSPPLQLTINDKFQAIGNVISAFFSAAGAVLDFEISTDNLTFTPHIKKAYVRSLLSSCNPLQLQWVFGSSTKAYTSWFNKHVVGEEGLKMRTDILEDGGAKLHWIGREDAEKVILYFHGDGFITPLNKDHLRFMNGIRLDLKYQAKVNVKLAFLEYTLIPNGHYPTQLRQAALALRHLFNLNISPSNILIAGDSTGGLLAVQLLSHILHPHPSIEPIKMPTSPFVPLAGIIAVSPWIALEDHHTRLDNDSDFMPDRLFKIWSTLMKEHDTKSSNLNDKHFQSSDIDSWQQPASAPAEWWHDTYKYTSHILLTYGTTEFMADDIHEFGKDLDKAFRGTKVGMTVISERKGMHNGPVLGALALDSDQQFMKSIVQWVKDRFVKN